ncbi:hypothetical protein [Methylophaga sp.]|uniref:hypothetical protein n=1 Tax=Methylophaga sp. TaxID=2024840 RepID=UPI0025E5C3E1|nr:hypothetical protein [Methylophaga sp.]
MKLRIIFLINLFILSACTTSDSVKKHSGPNSSTIKPQRIQISEIGINEYKIRYNGLLKDSLQDAQKNWMQSASEACKGNKFTYRVTEQGFVSNYQEKPPTVSVDLSGLCISGGAAGCIIASIFSSTSKNTKSAAIGSSFAAVEGTVKCEEN